jgi:PIN domain nuclease of toxin-antitoxin system
MILLDTHIWLWILSGESRLSNSARTTITSARLQNSLYLSPISMWEIALKAFRGKLKLDRPTREWLPRAIVSSGIQITPITSDVAAESGELPPEFHGDPADRIIAATARNEGFTLITHDKQLLGLAKQGYFKALAT